MAYVNAAHVNARRQRPDRLETLTDADAAAAMSLAGCPEPAPVARLPSLARRGRGAVSNPASRFDASTAEAFDDGWNTLADALGREGLAALPPLPTTLTPDRSRTVLSWNSSPDLGFDRAVNPYRGCEHGCVYCYARPTHAYLGYSPGLDFETKLTFKPDVAAQLEREISRPGYVVRPIALGSNTDPYQPVERTLRLTRSVLEVLERFGHPLSIVTKSAGVLRDLDILRRLADRNLVRVWLSVTTLDPKLALSMEPRAGVLAAPMIPGLNDAELERILGQAAAAGARHAGYVLLRLPLELRQMFEAWLAEHLPDRARHVLSLIRETRAGQLNDSSFHERFVGAGPYAELLARRFAIATRAHGFEGRDGLATEHFAVPRREIAAPAQMALF